MSKKPAAMRTRHVPQRTCVGCREVLAKRQLVRVVRTPQGIQIDRTGKAAGRGAYLHDRRSCWERALRGPLAQALRTDITPADRALLQHAMERLPLEAEEEPTRGPSTTPEAEETTR